MSPRTIQRASRRCNRGDGRASRRRSRGDGRASRRRGREGRRRAGRGGRHGRQRQGRSRRADRQDQAAASRRLPRVRVLRLPGARRRAGRPRARAPRHGGRRDLRRQPLRAARRQRSLSPRRLAATIVAPVDAPARPRDDLRPHRRHGDAVLAAGDGGPAGDGAADRRVGRRLRRHRGRDGVDDRRRSGSRRSSMSRSV